MATITHHDKDKLVIHFGGTESLTLSWKSDHEVALTSTIERDPGDSYFNGMLDGFEALLIALYQEQVDLTLDAQLAAIQTAWDAIGNHADDGLPFEAPAAIDTAFRNAGYYLDGAETTSECAGYSRFLTFLDLEEVYSFGVVDKDSVQVYATHGSFGRLAKGTYKGCEADGEAHLTVSFTRNTDEEFDAETLVALLSRLDTAVTVFFLTRRS